MTRLRQENEILKSNGYIHEVNLYSKILFIENESNEYPTRMLLRVMEVAQARIIRNSNTHQVSVNLKMNASIKPSYRFTQTARNVMVPGKFIIS